MRRRWCVLCLACSGCGTPRCDTSGFEQLSGKSPRAIDFPGEELAQVGDFTPYHALGRDGDLVAVVGADSDGNVHVVDARSGEVCTAVSVAAGSASRLVPQASGELFVTLQSRDADGRGPLQLYDSKCEPVLEPFEQARAVLGTERLVPEGLLLFSDSELYFVDSASRQSTLIERDVIAVSITADNVVIHRGAQVVVRDFSLSELAVVGTDVSELLVINGAGRLVYIDTERLFLLGKPTGAPQRLALDACRVALADGHSRASAGPRFLSYFTPCDSNELVLYDLTRDASIDVGLADGPAATVRSFGTGDEEEVAVFFYEPREIADVPTVELSVRAGRETMLLGPVRLQDVGLPRNRRVPMLVDDGESRELVEWSLDGDVEVLHTDVLGFEAQSFPQRVLFGTQQDGTLSSLETADEEELASGSLWLGRGNSRASLFAEQVEDNVGSLRLLTSQPFAVQAVDEDVHLPSANFWFSGETLFYLRNYDGERGELCMRVVDGGDTYCEPDIESFRVLNRPKRGVATVKVVGSSRRLFWSAVQ